MTACSTPKNHVIILCTLLIQRSLNRQLELNLWTLGTKTGIVQRTYCPTMITMPLELYEGRLRLTIEEILPKNYQNKNRVLYCRYLKYRGRRLGQENNVQIRLQCFTLCRNWFTNHHKQLYGKCIHTYTTGTVNRIIFPSHYKILSG